MRRTRGTHEPARAATGERGCSGTADESIAALDALPRAVIVVDDTLHVRYLNVAAIALLEESTDIRMHADRLVPWAPQVATRLAQRVREACSPQPSVDPLPLHALDREQRPTLETHVVPLQPHLTAPLDRDARPLAMLLLRRPFQRIARPDADARPFALTRAEMAVATSLASGLTPAEYAACNCVRISTVRIQIKAIFAKTGVRRIADLVALFGA
ncbi:MAG TPA: hypothetical protein VJR91_09835 [Burkholderia sp.]|nr:hypothetical protein [Burkholderia sp.]